MRLSKFALLGLLALCSPAGAQVPISALPSAATPLAGTEVLPCVQGGVTKKCAAADVHGPTGVTTTGSPANGNITKFSGAATVTNGDVSGDCTTSGTLAITCTKTSGVALGTFATQSAPTGGGIQCLHASNTGAVTGTGSDCGAGGGGTSPGGSNTQLQYNSSGSFGGITGATSNGTVVTLTSPILVTPALGVPSSGTGTNITGVPLGTGTTGTLAVARGGTGVTAAQGNGSKVQLSTGSTTLNNCGKYDTNGNIIDAGAPCGTGAGSVTSVATGACLTGGPITTSGTVAGTSVIRSVTAATDTVLSSDACKRIVYNRATAIAVTLPQATGSFGSGFGFEVQNEGPGLVTITPTTSTINAAAALTVPQNTGCYMDSDGTNYHVASCTALPSSNGGTFTANGATAVVVANTAVSANSVITFTLKTVGGTPAGAPFLSAVTAGTGFSVKAVAGDTSVYNYQING